MLFKFFTLSFVSVILLLLTSCGNEKLCVMGFGDCKAPEKPTTTLQNTNSLTLTTSKSSIAINQTATLTISGGVSPYNLQFHEAATGGLSGTPGIFSSATSYTYTAAATTGTTTFKVTDSASPAKTVFVSVVITANR